MIRCLKSARYLSNFSPVHNVLKDDVYRRKVRDLADLRQLINETVDGEEMAGIFVTRNCLKILWAVDLELFP